MLTRGTVQHAYGPGQPERASYPGYIRAETVNNIVHTWPITRPVAGWNSQASTQFPGGTRPARGLIRGGVPGIAMTQPNSEMDPSDPRTWQRPYVFSN